MLYSVSITTDINMYTHEEALSRALGSIEFKKDLPKESSKYYTMKQFYIEISESDIDEFESSLENMKTENMISDYTVKIVTR